MREVINTENKTENNRVKRQITLKDVKIEMRSINRRVYKEKRPNVHVFDSYTNSMDIVLSKKKEIENYYKDNMKYINDDELIKIYDNYVTDEKKANDFSSSCFSSIVISTINTLSINSLIDNMAKNGYKDYNGFLGDVIATIIILIVSLLIAWAGVKYLNRDSNKYEIKEVYEFHSKLLFEELNKRNKPVQQLSKIWELKEYKKRNRFLFFLPLLPVRKIKGFLSIVMHPFSKLNRSLSRANVISKQINKLEKALKEAENLNDYERKIIKNLIQQKLDKEEKLLNDITGSGDDSSE